LRGAEQDISQIGCQVTGRIICQGAFDSA